MTAEAVGVQLNKKLTNVMVGDHMSPEFLKINPQHTIPTLVDNNFSLWESRAICIYLVEKYAKNDSLYPKDPKKRAVINQLLQFDAGTLFPKFSAYYVPIFMKQPADPEKFKDIETALRFLDIFLSTSKYAAGDKVTVADFVLLATVSTFEVAKFDLSSYTNVTKWYELCKTTAPGWETNWNGVQEIAKYFN